MQTKSIITHGICNHSIALHARVRMQQRAISASHVETVLRYGRVVFSRGLTFRVIGRNEVRHFSAHGLDLSHAEGIHVLVDSDGTVITTYRNHDLRKIRPTKRKHSMHH
jgi:hypothetical protein